MLSILIDKVKRIWIWFTPSFFYIS